MKRLGFNGFGAIAGAALVVAMCASGALAQQSYATGALRQDPDKLRSLPQADVYRDFLPPAVDLSRYMPAVGDQLNQASCVGWATAYAARGYYAYQVEHRDIQMPENIPSPAWVFNIIKAGGTCDQGSYVTDAMDVLRQGARSIKDYPYDGDRCPTPLPPARMSATDFRIDSYEIVWGPDNAELDNVKGALAKGHPVVISASLSPSYFGLNSVNSVWTATIEDSEEGGHAFTVVGYDDATQTFKFINSWNTTWGDEGYGRMTYDTFKARVWEGVIMHLPGEPGIALTETDFVADIVDLKPTPPPIIRPPLTPQQTTRAFGAAPVAVDLGPEACGRVDVATDADGNVVATGFVGTEADLARVETQLKGQVDEFDVTLAPWPACEVRLTLAHELADTDVPRVAVAPEAPSVGDQLIVGIETPGFASYLYAAYFSADGNVVSIAQPSSADLKPKKGRSLVQLGDEGDTGAVLTVAPPVGEEMLLVMASEQPLFGTTRPDKESYRQYLTALREGLLAGDAGRVTATLLPVTTTD